MESIQPPPESPAISTEKATRPRPRWGRIVVWTAVIALLAVLFLGLLRTQEGSASVGQRAPDFTFTTFEGEQLNLADLRGKVVLINFWASWCIPCEQEAPELEAAWRYYQPRGDVVFLGVDWTDTESAAKQYLAKFDITYPNGPDLGTRISQKFRITGVPETYIVDQNGILASVRLYGYETIDEIKAAIDPLLQP